MSSMAHPQIGSSLPTRLSFARIAAMPAPNVAPALPNVIRESKPRQTSNVSQHARAHSQTTTAPDIGAMSQAQIKSPVDEITTAVANYAVTRDDMPDSLAPPSGASGDSLADDQSQLSSSSIKQQSFDTKSLASVTTFAMDEKESIRPDDSASVRAVEEDDIHPGLSRNSSFQQEVEVHSVPTRSHVSRTLGPSVTMAARRQPYTTLTNPPRFGNLPIEPMAETTVLHPHVDAKMANLVVDEGLTRPALPISAPDEKLLEALSSLKDRLPLLQLEEKIMTFINNGRDLALELPPQNSFTRLLTHKLADYYNLAHHINDENNSVRIFRTDYCTLPVPLAEIAKSVPIGTQQISQATQVKIMRRVQLGTRPFSAGNSTAASSSVPSKATSENGIEIYNEEGLQPPAEGTPSKDWSKLTREEREAQYKAARERIFGDFQESVTSESGSTGEVSASLSRSSSSSGKKKSRKHRTPKDDTFEARSSFIPSYAPMHMQPMYQQVYNDMQYSNGYVSGSYSPNAYNGAISPSFPGYDSNLAYNSQVGYNSPNGTVYGGHTDSWHNHQQVPSSNFYNYQAPQVFQQQPMSPQLSGQYQPSSPLLAPQASNWAPNQFQNMYGTGSAPAAQSSANWQSFNGGNMQGAMPYQYGQLPPQPPAGGVPFANQHPVPGSFTGSKSLFNPQTRSFVPNNTSARGGSRGGRKKAHGLGSTRTSGTNSPAMSSMNDSIPAKLKEDSLQQKYGTLANLPKKPPPSQV